MSNTDPAQEPSMEEILASIRKIISDDDSAETDTADGDSANADSNATKDADTVSMSAEHEHVEIEEPAEVAEPAIADPEPVAEAPEPRIVVSKPESLSDMAGKPKEDVLDLTEDLAVDKASADEEAADVAMEASDPGIDLPDDGPGIVETDDEDIGFAPTKSVADATASASPSPAQANQSLMTDEKSSDISKAFMSLENLVLDGKEKTLDGLVREMLKPLLKEWLDANLPPLVDRMVRDEIERVSRGRK